ncbi:MAG: hypothetical protein R2755_13320 [Acidimicrobiales bacterium]
MLTGQQYKDLLADGRLTYFEGQRIDDLPGHPLPSARQAPHRGGLRQAHDPSPTATSLLLSVPRSADDLRALIPMLHDAA